MRIDISFDGSESDRELLAIVAAIAALRPAGSAPVLIHPNGFLDSTVRIEPNPSAPPAPPAADVAPVPADAPPPPADTPAPPAPSPPASDALIQQEAARATSTGDLDVNGIPWDERIHAGTKVKNADNSWRTKRGADPALVASVTAELKAASTASPALNAGEAPPPPTEPGPATVADAATAFGAGGASNASDVPPPPAADGNGSLQEQMAAVAAGAVGAVPPPPADTPPAADDAEALTYPRILDRATEAGVDYETLNGLAVGFGLAKFMDLPKRPDLFPLFLAAMEEHIASAPAA